MFRRRRSHETLLAGLFITALTLWAVASIFPGVASTLNMKVLGSYFQFLLAIAAALGVHEILVRWGGHLRRAAEELVPPAKRLKRIPGANLGYAFLVALSLPWCFPYWWQPLEMDPVWIFSLRPVSRQVLGLTEWIRSSTEAEAAFVAGPSYGHWIAALSGRRVLLVEHEGAGGVPPDVDSRKRAESWIIESRDPQKIRAASREWNLTHLAWGRLDQETARQVDFDFLESDATFSEVWRLRRWVRVFELHP
jgi:hypothetical protein